MKLQKTDGQDARDAINPKHYVRGGLEAIDVLEVMVAGWAPATALRLGQAVQYIFRHANKGGLEDLHKARWYIEREIAARERAR